VEPGPNHVVAPVCVCCWLCERAHAPGLRGPGLLLFQDKSRRLLYCRAVSLQLQLLA
jgi:hypothetical protein